MRHKEWLTTTPGKHLIAQRCSECTRTHDAHTECTRMHDAHADSTHTHDAHAECTQGAHRHKPSPCTHTHIVIAVVQLLSHVWLCLPHRLQHARLPCPSLSQSLLRIMSIRSMMLSNHLTLCNPLLLLPSIFPNIRVFSNEWALHIKWPKAWSFSFSISPSNVYSGLISFRIDWFDLLAVQGTLKSLLLHHNLKASVLQHSAFFMVQLSHPYMTTEKTIALITWTFVGKVMSLLFLICCPGLS